MARTRDPREEKDRDSTKQQRGFSEYAHALRHGKWRKTKRRPAQQRERQAERRAISTPAQAELADEGFDPGLIARPRIEKWKPVPLGTWIEQRKAGRAQRANRKKKRRPAPP